MSENKTPSDKDASSKEQKDKKDKKNLIVI